MCSACRPQSEWKVTTKILIDVNAGGGEDEGVYVKDDCVEGYEG